MTTDNQAWRAGREDASLVAAAANDGRISADTCPQWLMAMKADRDGTRRTLASLSPVLRPDGGFSSDVDRAHQGVMAALARQGIRPTDRADRVEASSSSGTGSVPSYAAPGLPTARKVGWGKPIDQWTQREIDDSVQWQLGPRFRHGLRPPPGGDSYYIPSGDPETIEVPEYRFQQEK